MPGTKFNPSGGLRSSRVRGGARNPEALNRYRIANNFSENIFKGDAVALNTANGTITQVSGTGAGATNRAAGVFQGCTYVDPITRRPTWSNMYLAGVSAAEGQPQALVIDNPDQTFIIQADASVTVGDIGLNFDVSLNQGSSFTQTSGFLLRAASRTAGAALLRLVDIYEVPGNALAPDTSVTDAFPFVEVQWNQHRTAFTSAA